MHSKNQAHFEHFGTFLRKNHFLARKRQSASHKADSDRDVTQKIGEKSRDLES